MGRTGSYGKELQDVERGWNQGGGVQEKGGFEIMNLMINW